MTDKPRMTDKQRVVVSIAGGLLLVVAAIWWNNRAINDGGWFNYAPDTGTIYSGQPSGGRTALVWIAAVVIWGAGSLWLFRHRNRTDV